jgi:alpha-tubulin suppressor-like RCC1 family protein
MAHDVFISHSSKDKTIADAVCAGLEKRGIKCWIAPRNINPGEEWPVAIVNAVTSSRAMILVFSENANQSKDVAKETLLAINSDIEILPLKIEATEPKDRMQYYLSDRRWFDATAKPLPEMIRELVAEIGPAMPEKEPGGEDRAAEVKVAGEGTIQPSSKNRFDPAAFIREKKKIFFPATGMAALTLIGLLYFLFIPRVEPALIRAVEAGGNSSFILMENGELYAFGDHLHGQLGLGEGEKFSRPHKLDTLAPIRAVSTGKSHTLFLLEDGSILAAGLNTFGQLGFEDRKEQQRFIPEIIPGLEEGKALAVGENHSLALLENGNIFSFGRKLEGQLGHSGLTAAEFSLRFESMISPPEAIESLIGTSVRTVTASYGFSLVLLENGEVYSFGISNSGQLGHGDRESKMEPEKIDSLAGAAALAAGISHTLVLLESGELYSFGMGLTGQLGHGDRETLLVPKKVDAPADIIAIAAGGNHSLILTEDGHVYSFGSGVYGALGHGDQEDRLVPTRIETLEKVRAIAAGRDHSIVLTDEDEVLSFGRNQSGQLGVGDQENRLEPTAVEMPWRIEE